MEIQDLTLQHLHTMRLVELTKILMRYDKLPLECDGMTKVLSYVLKKLEIPHFINGGILTGPKGGIPHFWIELDDMYIDLRCRMWQGENDGQIPHGIFDPHDYPVVTYDMQSREVWEVPDMIYTILTGEKELLTE